MIFKLLAFSSVLAVSGLALAQDRVQDEGPAG